MGEVCYFHTVFFPFFSSVKIRCCLFMLDISWRNCFKTSLVAVEFCRMYFFFFLALASQIRSASALKKSALKKTPHGCHSQRFLSDTEVDDEADDCDD